MHFAGLIAAAAAITAVQAVQFTNTVFNNVTAGEPFTISWSNATGPVTLLLKNGAATDLKTVSTIASGLSGTSYTWAVPSTLVNLETYAVEIEDQSPPSSVNPNYSEQFQMIGGVTSSSAASSSTSSSASASSSASTTSSASVTSSSSSATVSSSSSANSTASTTASSTSGSSTASTATSATGATTATSAPSSASGLSSPLAFVFLALAAMLTLN